MTEGELRHRRLVLDAPWDDESDPFVHLALLAAIVESSDDAIVSKTLEGTILSWNAGATRIFGYDACEAIGKPITLIIPPELWGEEEGILGKVRRGQRVEHFDTIRIAKDGRRIPMSLTISPIRDAHGVIVGASKVGRDISERKRAEAALRESEQRLKDSEEALKEAMRRKNEFLALIGHELRNQLAPLRYSLSASCRPNRTPEQHKRAQEVMERQITVMGRLLDDLLDLSRLTQSTLQLKKVPTDLAHVVGSAIDTARPAIEAKGHKLTVELPKEPISLQADPLRLSQVFSNLLINAAKYTDPGGAIQVRASANQAEVVVAIRDTGMGIVPEMIPRLFTMFTQSPRALSRAEGGLGIGLSLVRGLVELHGGRVEARSEGPNTGSEFVVRLPRQDPGTTTADNMSS